MTGAPAPVRRQGRHKHIPDHRQDTGQIQSTREIHQSHNHQKQKLYKTVSL